MLVLGKSQTFFEILMKKINNLIQFLFRNKSIRGETIFVIGSRKLQKKK